MCLGCRERGPVTELVRVAVIGVPGDDSDNGVRLVIDRRKSLPGRGAWLHPSQSCVTAAVRRQAFGPALRVRGLKVHPDDLVEIFGEAGHEGSAGSQDR
ncbi:MAG: YlxR family protein [Gordonia sp. (in: high G+C Gram-positive bacteria)]|uniref:YlxR family protein n=1 Tax=Gordonia sp. (in: high G+C Gram-positive bacteria) TaxID=84139 RepID=UPI0039E6E7F8